LAEGLAARGNLRCEFLYDADKRMRKTIERLRPAEFAPASQHQSEALALLIEAREAIRVAFGKSPPSEVVRRFDREQAQKLRKPKDKSGQAEMLASRLRQLAEEEEFVYATLGGVPCEQGSPSKTPSAVPSPTNSSPSSQPSPQSAEGNSKAAESQQAAREGDRKQPSESPAESQPKSSEQGQQLEQRQRDIVLDAYEAERIMQGLEGMTELARSRMRRGTQEAEEASGALARGDRDAAREAAGEAGGEFRELARHVEGLTASDLAGKIGISRDLAADLAERQRGLANRLDRDAPPGSPSPGPTRESGQDASGSRSRPPDGTSASRDQPSDGQGDHGGGQRTGEGEPKKRGDGESIAAGDGAARLAEGSRTLQDLLDAAARDADADGDVAAKITAAREQARLGALIQQMDSLQQRPRGQQLAEFQAEAREHADRLELLAQQLDALHGTILAPRLTELIALEKRAAALRDRLERLASDAEISQWHLDAQQQLQALEKADSGGAAVDALRQAMSDAGWGTSRTGWTWARVLNPVGGHYYFVAPGVYRDNLTRLAENLQREARELLLRDLMAAGQEAVPPQYEKLVDRYFEVLSQEKKQQ
jgi:hypothetical protein